MSNRMDNFNRADNTSTMGTPSDGGSDWVADQGTWGITGNAGYTVAGAGDNQCIATLESSLADVSVECKITFVSTTDCGIVGRVADSTNYILVAFRDTGNTIELYTRIAGTFTSLGAYTGSVATGDVIKLTMNGASLEVFQNGISRLTASNGAGSSNTKHGLRQSSDFGSGNTRFDDFSITGAAAADTGLWLIKG